LGTVVFELDKERTTAPTSPIENATAIPITIRIRFSVNSARFTKGTIVLVVSPGAASDKSANQRRSLACTESRAVASGDLRKEGLTRIFESLSLRSFFSPVSVGTHKG